MVGMSSRSLKEQYQIKMMRNMPRGYDRLRVSCSRHKYLFDDSASEEFLDLHDHHIRQNGDCAMSLVVVS